MRNRLQFLLCSDVTGYTFNPHLPEGIEFTFPDQSSVIRLKAKTDGHRDIEAKVTAVRDISSDYRSFVENIIEKKYLVLSDCPLVLPVLDGDKELVSVAGEVVPGYSITFDMLPLGLQRVCQEVTSSMAESLVRFLSLLRWQQNASGPHAAFPHLQAGQAVPVFFWKTEHENCYLAPLPRNQVLSVSSSGGMRWEERHRVAFGGLWSEAGAAEPLAHELLREAKLASNENPRSALLMAYSALEVGIKQHIGKMVPDAAWLAENAPTPPLDKIFRDYLPKLHVESAVFAELNGSNGLAKEIGEFTKARNALAHRGENGSPPVHEYIELVSDVLYFIDALEGRAWARDHLSRKRFPPTTQ